MVVLHWKQEHCDKLCICVFQEALEMLRSSLPLKNEAYGEYSENVSDTHKLIASIHLAQGTIEKSLRSYKKVGSCICIVSNIGSHLI